MLQQAPEIRYPDWDIYTFSILTKEHLNEPAHGSFFVQGAVPNGSVGDGAVAV